MSCFSPFGFPTKRKPFLRSRIWLIIVYEIGPKHIRGASYDRHDYYILIDTDTNLSNRSCVQYIFVLDNKAWILLNIQRKL